VFILSYDFDQVIDRQNSGSIKWNHFAHDVIPMWVADMDFRAPEPILRALHDRVAHGVFGYEIPSIKLAEAICAWLDKRCAWQVQTDDIVFLPGVVSGLNLVCRAFGHMGDSAIMLTPVYTPFHTAPTNQGMSANKLELKRVTDGRLVRYEVDYDAFERAITPRTSLFIHCHPHNPIGLEWSRQDLLKLGEICVKHDLVILSDEIWCDLMLGSAQHVPMASISPDIARRCVTLMAPSKTFNVPSMGFSFAVVQNPALRRRLVNAEVGIVPHVNALGLAAAMAAYTECEDWLDALRSYLTANRDVMLDYLARHTPEIHPTAPTATYLCWLDCRDVGVSGSPCEFLLKHAKVALSEGPAFGPGGENFARVNFGCPRSQLIEALERMHNAIRRRRDAA
jgi:cystathionine beta-lyase